MASTILTECFTSRNGTSAKMRKLSRWGMGRGGPRCDVCGADCGGWAELYAHLQKNGNIIRGHLGSIGALDDQRARVEQILEDMRSPRRRAA